MARLLGCRGTLTPNHILIPFLSLSNHYRYHCTTVNHDLRDSIEEKAFSFLNCCRTPNHLFQIQAYLIASGLFGNPFYTGRLLQLSSNLIEDLGYTLLIFKHIGLPDALCVNTIIKSYSCRKYHKKAVLFYVRMLRDGKFSPNCYTFPPLLSACAKLGDWSLGQMCHGHTMKFGVETVLPVHNSLLHLCALCERMDVASKVFDEMLVKDLVSWNTMIDGFAKVGEMRLAHELFDAMPAKNVVSWNVMITGYLNFRSPGNALKLFREMVVRRFKCSDTTMVNVSVACGRSNRLKEGRSVHAFLVKEHWRLSLFIDTALIDMYSKCGKVDFAQVIFDRMLNKNTVSWNAMILGHCIHGNPLDGLGLYSEMVDKICLEDDTMTKSENAFKDGTGNSILPDELTFIGVLCACVRTGMLAEGLHYFSQMVDVFRLKPNFAHYWCLANLKANAGLMQEAMDMLRNIPNNDVVSPEYSIWAGLFGTCRFVGDVTLGEQIAKHLIEHDPQNFSHYNLLVNVYAVAGRWEEVEKIKDLMKERGIGRLPCCNLKDLTEIVHNVQHLEY